MASQERQREIERQRDMKLIDKNMDNKDNSRNHEVDFITKSLIGMIPFEVESLPFLSNIKIKGKG